MITPPSTALVTLASVAFANGTALAEEHFDLHNGVRVNAGTLLCVSQNTTGSPGQNTLAIVNGYFTADK